MPSLELPSLTNSSVVQADSQPSSAVLLPEDQPIGVTATQTEPLTELHNWGFLSVFSSTFITIFLAELGDKTQLATLLMAAESHQPWVVFAGAASALVMTSLVGVLLGRWLYTRLSPQTLEKATGLILLFVAIGLILDLVQM